MAAIRLYRLVHRKYAGAVFSGEGGLFHASRWASRGQLVSYASESLALAVLEKLTGIDRLSRLSEMVYAVGELDETLIEAIEVRDLPSEWDRHPAGTASRAFGDDWLRSETAPAIKVPSVVLPESWNFILNPSHPEFSRRLTAGDPISLTFDPRVIDRLTGQTSRE